MKINLLSFGQVADIIGEANLSITDIQNTEELKDWLIDKWPKLQSIKYSIAINRNIIQENTELQNEDTVALLPPFSGG